MAPWRMRLRVRQARTDRRRPPRPPAGSPCCSDELTARQARAKRPAHSAHEALSGGRGGIGRHARLRISCRKAWGFKSLRPHQTEEMPDGRDGSEPMQVTELPADGLKR